MIISYVTMPDRSVRPVEVSASKLRGFVRVKGLPEPRARELRAMLPSRVRDVELTFSGVPEGAVDFRGLEAAAALAALGDPAAPPVAVYADLREFGPETRVGPVRGAFLALEAASGSGLPIVLSTSVVDVEVADTGRELVGSVDARLVGDLDELVEASKFKPDVSAELPDFGDGEAPEEAWPPPLSADLAQPGVTFLLVVGGDAATGRLRARELHAALPQHGSIGARRRARILSSAGFPVDQAWERPFRAPHHTASLAGYLGDRGRPGELDLAEGGVLLLDDWGEVRKSIRARLIEELPKRRILVVAKVDEPLAESAEAELKALGSCVQVVRGELSR